MRSDYDDIINLPHYEPKHHPRMSMWSRAAQFAPFAALTGYDDAAVSGASWPVNAAKGANWAARFHIDILG